MASGSVYRRDERKKPWVAHVSWMEGTRRRQAKRAFLTKREAQLALYRRWLERAGIVTNGHPVEVSPLFAIEADEVRTRIPPGFVVSGPTHLK